MEDFSIEKGNYSWHDISILADKEYTSIFFLFSDNKDCERFFKMVTEDNKNPSFYCVLLPDGTHELILDFSILGKEQFLKVHCSKSVKSYPPLGWLQEEYKYKIVMGFMQGKNVMGTGYSFIPSSVQYVEAPKTSTLPKYLMN